MQNNVTTRFIEELCVAAEKSGFVCEEYGMVEGYPLILFHREAIVSPAPTVYLSSGMHGDEPAGPGALLDLLREEALPCEVNWIIFPLLNPTGYNAETRENFQGIDLNRDYFSLRSEEAKAHASWLKKNRQCIDLYISLHEDWEARGFYMYEINTSNFEGQSEAILAEVERVVPLEQGPIVDDHELLQPGLIRHKPEPDEPEGWPEAIFACKAYPLLSYTFETPSSQPLELRRNALKRAVLTALQGI